MRLLTGASPSAAASDDTFLFVPDSITPFGPTVLAEGFDTARSIFWVHAWTVSADGIVTQVREYFNTSLTVTRFGDSPPSDPSTAKINSLHCQSLWESSVSSRVGKSVPGLVLAI
ncbi:wound-induced protein 1-like [Rhodamnia argentea]|uniref:Wound-induced protein 1-like n=1 Tax=Rhodamnia argentea TaxID=178133 RepID=A0A8B8Q1E0_9MYRT|nr:wound-induced protein 1-like [Rhodamnia argentea]